MRFFRLGDKLKGQMDFTLKGKSIEQLICEAGYMSELYMKI
jgi:hypothetical protein